MALARRPMHRAAPLLSRSLRARRLLVRPERQAARDAAARALRRAAAADADRHGAKASSQRFVAGAKPVPEWWKLYRSDALNALVDEGLRNSPNLAAADKSLAAAREQLRAQIGSSLLPSIDAGGAGVARSAVSAIPEFGPPTVLYNLFVGQIQAQYTFDLFGAARYANAALAAQVDQQAFQLDAARRALAANIVTGAIGAAALRAQIDTHRAARRARQRRCARCTHAATHSARRRASDALNAQQSAASLAASVAGLARAMARDAPCARGAARPHAGPGARRSRSREPRRAAATCRSWCRRICCATRPDIQAADAAVEGRRRASRRRDGAVVSEPVAVARRWAKAASAGRPRSRARARCGASAHRCRSRSFMAAPCSRSGARRIDTYDAAVLAVQADGALGVPERREYAGVARTRTAQALASADTREPRVARRIRRCRGARAARRDPAARGARERAAVPQRAA